MAHTQTHRHTRWRALLVAMAATLVAVGAVAGIDSHDASATFAGWYRATYKEFGQGFEATAVSSNPIPELGDMIVFSGYLMVESHGNVHIRLVGPGYVSRTVTTGKSRRGGVSTESLTHYCDPGEVFDLETWIVVTWSSVHHHLKVPCVPENSSGSW